MSFIIARKVHAITITIKLAIWTDENNSLNSSKAVLVQLFGRQRLSKLGNQIMEFADSEKLKPGVIGLGYVGLPLAAAIDKKYDVVGYDINQTRINQLKQNVDTTHELEMGELEKCSVVFTSSSEDLRNCNIYIITVPTPIDTAKTPDFGPLISASNLAGKHLKKGDIVVYESTVYPGATEEVCVPLLESASGLKYNVDFFVGYSPERINPGDKTHRVNNILKITSGSTDRVANLVDAFYSSFIDAGTYKAQSIRVAEAAKVIENTQRDVNIALVNELAVMFDKMGIDTHSVLEAAATKWNFLKFVPGLVGGHCIGVDPYYLTHKAKEIGYHPDIILAGRRVNDSMPKFVADKLILSLVKSKLETKEAKILVMGATFKENCPDLRNSKVIELVQILHDYGVEVDVFDPKVSSEQLFKHHGLKLSEKLHSNAYHAIVLAVRHDEFMSYSIEFLRTLLSENGIIFDLQNMFPTEAVDLKL